MAEVVERWFESATRAVITMRPVQGGGEGYHVQLVTSAPVSGELTRQTYSPDALFAAERVVWLMDQVPGQWRRLPVEP